MSETATTITQSPADRAQIHYEARRMVKTESLKNAIGAITNERDTARSEAARLAKENEEIKRKYDGSALAKQNQELSQKVRVFGHRKTFDKLAVERGANPAALDILYEKSGWKAEADEFDEAEMAAVIDQAKPALGFLFGQQPGEQSESNKPGAGSGQGHRDKRPGADNDIIEDDDDRMSDAAWQMKNPEQMLKSVVAKQEREERRRQGR